MHALAGSALRPAPQGCMHPRRRRSCTTRAEATPGGEGEEGGGSGPPPAPQPPTAQTPAEAARAASAIPSAAGRRRRQADSTDPIASALTRRFGLAGGLGWAAVLTAGVLGEQIKTRLEEAGAARDTAPVVDAPPLDLGGGVVAQDLTLGGGDRPAAGLLAVLELAVWPAPASTPAPPTLTPSAAVAAASAAGPPYFDTRATGKPLVLLVGGRPLTGGLCPGAERAMLGMRAGGKRAVAVPAAAGFGDKGAVLRPTRHVQDKAASVPPGQDLVYRIELLRISVPPS